MKSLFKEVDKILKEGRRAALVTITASSGATPRGVGSHMVVDREGLVAGTIGGGMVEYRAMQMAQEGLEKGKAFVHDFVLNRDDVEDLGMICGGDVTVDFRLLSEEDEDLRDILDLVLAETREDQRAWLLALPTQDLAGLALIYEDGDMYGALAGLPEGEREEVFRNLKAGKPWIQVGGQKIYAEEIQSGARLLVFGGGHVGQALVPIAAGVGFACHVYEDREDFARKDLFPEAESVQRIAYDRIAEAVTIRPSDYVCIMTRGHAFDEIIEDQVLHTEARYIGVIGSRKKKAAVDANLHARGHSWENISRIVSPIGLTIGAETPEEIAVSITAELIGVRAGLPLESKV